MPERSVQNLIAITSAGLDVATYPEIKQAVQRKYKEIYGSDIDLTNTTADGVFIENICLIIANILTSVEMLYSNLNINTASGSYLDNLCALTGVYRKKATRSVAQLTITNNEATAIVLDSNNNLTFVDKSGYTWSTDIGGFESQSPFTTITLTPATPILIPVYCDEYGPVTAPAGWIYQLIDLSYDLTISQTTDAVVGSNVETDAELRARRNETISSIGLSTLSNLKGALLEITGIDDVEIYNNDSSNSATALDTTTILPRSVYIILRQRAGLDIENSIIGNRIYEKLTPGILTNAFTGISDTGANKSYTYNSAAGLSNVVYWKKASPIIMSTTTKLCIDIDLKLLTYFNTDTYEILKQTIVDYLNSLDISQTFSTYDLVNLLNEADPMFNGQRTYNVIDVVLKYNNTAPIATSPFSKTQESGSLYSYQAKDTYFGIDINTVDDSVTDHSTYVTYSLFGE